MDKKLDFSLFWGKYNIHVEDHSFPHSFSKDRDNTLCILQRIQIKEKIDTLIAIDGKEFTTNVEIYDAQKLKEWVIFLEAWIDGVIVHNIHNIEKKIAIILWIADCGGVVGATSDGNSMFNIHAGYKGVFWWEGNSGIIAECIKKMAGLGIDISEIATFLAPMAWNDFELPKAFVEKISSHFFTQYSQEKLMNFFQENENRDENGWEKWNLDLRKLMYALLKYHWIIHMTWFEENTTNPENDWSSFRLFSNKVQPIDSRLSIAIANNR